MIVEVDGGVGESPSLGQSELGSDLPLAVHQSARSSADGAGAGDGRAVRGGPRAIRISARRLLLGTNVVPDGGANAWAVMAIVVLIAADTDNATDRVTSHIQSVLTGAMTLLLRQGATPVD